ncbi:MAG: type 1 pili tip component [Woeseiaceae bacterium]
MSFKPLLDAWSERKAPDITEKDYSVRLSIDDAARIQALVDLYPGMDTERIITDLISTALDELQAAMPYVPGERVIREDDHGDPVYEDAGPTPRFLELVRAHRKKLQGQAD